MKKAKKWLASRGAAKKQKTPAKTAQDIFFESQHFNNPISDEDKEIIKKNVEFSCEYARVAIKGRWPEAEPYILDYCSHDFSQHEVDNRHTWQEILDYTESMIKGRWPELETILIKYKNLDQIYEYASRIIEKSWPEAEPILAESSQFAYDYANHVLEDRFEIAEEKIAKSTYGLSYAMDVLRKRWPEAEKYTIENLSKVDFHDVLHYASEMIGGRWLELEDAIIHNSNLCIRYVETIRKRWPEFEKRMLSLKSPQKILRYIHYVPKIGEELHNKMIMLSFSDENKERVNQYFAIIENRKKKHRKFLDKIKNYLNEHKEKSVEEVMALIDKEEYTHLAKD
jgi:CRISPR/Cas system CSM-associated protein Csm2 small subunit